MAEVVEYQGHRYRRYPNSPRRQHAVYFMATEPRRGYLHRHLWEDSFGPIPDGHDIHHRDGDSTNNALDNLECLPTKEHRSGHMSARSNTPEHLARLSAIRPVAALWHKSDAGRAWHRDHGKRTWEGRQQTQARCICCKSVLITPFPSRRKFCDQNCRERFVRRGTDEQWKSAR